METEYNIEIDPRHYVQLIFDKHARAIQWRKDSILTSGAGAMAHWPRLYTL